MLALQFTPMGPLLLRVVGQLLAWARNRVQNSAEDTTTASRTLFLKDCKSGGRKPRTAPLNTENTVAGVVPFKKRHRSTHQSGRDAMSLHGDLLGVVLSPW